jgi:hypothetical protein
MVANASGITKVNDMKMTDQWGVPLTSLELQRFLKYLENNRIAPNTMTNNERIQLVWDWKKLN